MNPRNSNQGTIMQTSVSFLAAKSGTLSLGFLESERKLESIHWGFLDNVA